MQVSDLIHQYNQNISAGSEISTGTKGVEQLVDTLKNLTKGQMFEGSVTALNGNKVTISLSNGQNINARLDSNVSLTSGQSLFFEVKSNDGNTIQIRPLVGEHSMNPTLLNALDAASIPVNGKNLNMVNQMMQNQMPIDSSSLSSMSRLVSSYPNAEVSDIISLKQLNIPVTSENLQNFENYRSNTNALVDSAFQLIDDQISLLNSDDIDGSAISSFESSLIKIVQLDGGSLDTEGITNKVNLDSMQISNEISLSSNSDNQVTGNPSNQNVIHSMPSVNSDQAVINRGDTNTDFFINKTESPLNDGDLSNLFRTEDQSGQSMNSNIMNSEINNLEINNSGINNLEINNSENINAVLEDKPLINSKTEYTAFDRVLNTLSKNDFTSLNNLLKKFSFDDDTASKILDNKGNIKSTLTVNELLDGIQKSLSSQSKDDLLSLIKNDGFKDLLKNSMSSAYTLKPNETAKENSVQNLYEKLETHLKLLEDSTNNLTKDSNNAVSKTISNIRSNIDFMNQLNQNYTYLQLPLKMYQQNAKADLYVYSNKSKKYQAGDEISAFLHFDLEHLGSTDISVKLKNSDVDTKFFMTDDSSYQLILNNIDLLEERLNKKGYSCKLSVELDQDEDQSGKSNFMELLKGQVNRGETSENNIVQRYSFDVRA